MSDMFVLSILTARSPSLYAQLLIAVVHELRTTDVTLVDGGPSDIDIQAALMRIGGNSCDDLAARALGILGSRVARSKFTHTARTAYIYKGFGLW